MSSRKNRSPEEHARRAKRRELLQESNISSMEDILVLTIIILVCYAGFLIFGISLFLAVFNGYTPLPKWACLFNTTLLMMALTPLRVGGSGNWAGAIMFLGLLFLL